MKMSLEEARDFLGSIYGGTHNLPGEVKPFGYGWCLNHQGDLATFDGDQLTRLVFLAHDRCVRVSILNSGPRMVRIVIHPRMGREGGFSVKHPTIEDALAVWRKTNPAIAEKRKREA